MEPEYNDAGQLERTVLAWNRSALAIAANGALIARAGFERHLLAAIVVGFAVIFVGAAVWVLSTGRYGPASGRLAGHVVAGRGLVVGAAAAFVLGVSAVDVALVATS